MMSILSPAGQVESSSDSRIEGRSTALIGVRPSHGKGVRDKKSTAGKWKRRPQPDATLSAPSHRSRTGIPPMPIVAYLHPQLVYVSAG